jgi:hypothetical protein
MRRRKIREGDEELAENDEGMQSQSSSKLLLRRFLLLILFVPLVIVLRNPAWHYEEVLVFFQALRFKPCDMTKERVSLPPVYVLNGRPLSQFQDVFNKNSKFIEMIVVGPSKEQTHNLTSHTLTFTCAPCSGFSAAWLTTIYANLFAFMLEKYARNEFSSLRSSFPIFVRVFHLRSSYTLFVRVILSSFEFPYLRSSFLTHLQ